MKLKEDNYINEVGERRGIHSNVLNVYLLLALISLLDILVRGVFDQLILDYLYIFPIILAGFVSQKIGFIVSLLTTLMSFYVNPILRSYILNIDKYNRDIELWAVILVTSIYFLIALISNMLIKKNRAAHQNQDRLKETLLKTTSSLSKALDSRDRYTGNHSSNVAQISFTIGKELGLSSKELYRLKRAAYLHDVGKIGISDIILNKEGSLSLAEYNLIKQHSEIGYQIIKDIPGLEKEARAVRYHHERWDGSGYPDGLAEKDIPLWARIISVADSIDAMISRRIYKEAKPIEEVIKELKLSANSQFDPEIVEVVLTTYNQGKLYLSS